MFETSGKTRMLVVGGLSVVGILMLLPIAWWAVFATAGSASLQPGGSLIDVWTPDRFALLDNIGTAFDLYPMGRFFLNSIVVASVVTIAEVLLSGMAGYAFAKLHFRGRDLLFRTLLGLLIIPQIVLVVPLFKFAVDTGFADTYGALIVPFLSTPFGVFLMRQFMSAIPDSFLEAARMEGASEWRILWTVVLPLCRNAMVSLAIFTFLLQWDSLLWPLIATSSEQLYTLPVGVSLLQSNVQVPYNALYAVTLAFSLPLLVAYLAFQRQFMQSLSFTGVRG